MAALTRKGLALREEDERPVVANASADWMRMGLELRGAGLWPVVGKARAAWRGRALRCSTQAFGQAAASLGPPRRSRA